MEKDREKECLSSMMSDPDLDMKFKRWLDDEGDLPGFDNLTLETQQVFKRVKLELQQTYQRIRQTDERTRQFQEETRQIEERTRQIEEETRRKEEELKKLQLEAAEQARRDAEETAAKLAEKDQQIEREKKEKEKLQQEYLQFTKGIEESGFPLLDTSKVTPFSTDNSNKWENYSFRIGIVSAEYKIREDMNDYPLVRPRQAEIWARVHGYDNKVLVGGERDAIDCVIRVMREIFDVCPAFPKYHVYVRHVTNLTCVNGKLVHADICAGSFSDGDGNRDPFFAIEVKKPGLWKFPAHTKLAHYQLYNYLQAMQCQYGIETPFGILTTYEQFQICWLDKKEGSNAKRKLYVTKVYNIKRQNHKMLFFALLSATLEGFLSPRRPPTMRQAGYYYCFDADNVHSVRFTVPTLRHVTPKVNVRNTKLFIYRHFEEGVEGMAYHVVDKTGAQGVVKLYNAKSQKSATKLCRQEQALWEKLNSIKVEVVTLNKQPALLMPYLEPLTVDEKIKFKQVDSGEANPIRDEIRKLFESLADHGYEQEDAAWRHIGWYHDGDVRSMRLFDFGTLLKIQNEEKTAAVDRMMGNLDFSIQDLRPIENTDVSTQIVESPSSSPSPSSDEVYSHGSDLDHEEARDMVSRLRSMEHRLSQKKKANRNMSSVLK